MGKAGNFRSTSNYGACTNWSWEALGNVKTQNGQKMLLHLNLATQVDGIFPYIPLIKPRQAHNPFIAQFITNLKPELRISWSLAWVARSSKWLPAGILNFPPNDQLGVSIKGIGGNYPIADHQKCWSADAAGWLGWGSSTSEVRQDVPRQCLFGWHFQEKED